MCHSRDLICFSRMNIPKKVLLTLIIFLSLTRVKQVDTASTDTLVNIKTLTQSLLYSHCLHTHSVNSLTMSKKLHYFNLNALAEPIRYILHYTKQEFDDIRHDRESWPKPEIKEKLPYGQFPLYEEGERVLHQSLAIAKYVARNTNLIPVDPWLQAVLESVAYTLYDFWTKLMVYRKEKDPAKQKELKEELLEETIDYFFSRLEKHLNENGGYFSGKLSWVEFVLCGIVEASNLFLDTELEKKYPAVEAVIEKIRNLPGVKEYIDGRAPYVVPKIN